MTRVNRRCDLKRLITCIFIVAVVTGFAGSGYARGIKSHMNRTINPGECMSCHSGFGVSGTALLQQSREDMCFECHGGEGSGKRKNRARTNIKVVLEKFSAHPIVDTSHLHGMLEQLPEQDASKDRHVACQDCHRVHITSVEEPTKGAKGYMPGSMRARPGSGKPKGLRLKVAISEYEICYLCHADSANLPFDSRNVSAEFNPINASFHPVESTGRNRNVPSLRGGLKENSRIGCISCHDNDDPSGPSGPHGSDNAHILVAPYRLDDGPEHMAAYELCYICHRRSNILGDNSFRRHNLHIVVEETSCRTCHTTHGSELNVGLMDFNPDVVEPSGSGGPVTYISGGGGATPKCFLKCHGTNHTPDGIGGKSWPW